MKLNDIILCAQQYDRHMGQGLETFHHPENSLFHLISQLRFNHYLDCFHHRLICSVLQLQIKGIVHQAFFCVSDFFYLMYMVLNLHIVEFVFFQVYNSMSLHAYVDSGHHHRSQDADEFYQPQVFLQSQMFPALTHHVPTPAQSLTTTALFSIPIVLPFSRCHINHTHLTFDFDLFYLA